jgi:hypothetical protein
VDAGVHQFGHVLVPLGVAAAGHGCVRQVVHHAHLRRPRQHRLEVQFLHPHAVVVHRATGDDLEVLDLRVGILAAVGLDVADDHVQPARPQRAGVLQQHVGLADARGGADVNPQAPDPGALVRHCLLIM